MLALQESNTRQLDLGSNALTTLPRSPFKNKIYLCISYLGWFLQYRPSVLPKYDRCAYGHNQYIQY